MFNAYGGRLQKRDADDKENVIISPPPQGEEFVTGAGEAVDESDAT